MQIWYNTIAAPFVQALTSLGGVFSKMAQATMTDLETLRHSTAHLMAQAVCELFPGTKLAIGPPIEDGFYYDVDPPQPITGEDLPRIEERMREIAARDLPIERIELPRLDALKLVRKLGQDYKVQIIEEIPEEETISFYRQGDFIDLCRGPHCGAYQPDSTLQTALHRRGVLARRRTKQDADPPLRNRMVYGGGAAGLPAAHGGGKAA
jgi:threonyl-tRNA synthetase